MPNVPGRRIPRAVLPGPDNDRPRRRRRGSSRPGAVDERDLPTVRGEGSRPGARLLSPPRKERGGLFGWQYVAQDVCDVRGHV